MVKRLILSVLVVFLLCTQAMAWDPAEYSLSSGEKTADALIMSGSGWFHQILVTPDGTNAVTVTVYDNTSGSGTKVIETMTFAGDGGTQATPPIWIYCSTGIYVDVTVAGGGSVAYAALYRKR